MEQHEKKVKRIISFDFLRGIAMIGVLGFHMIGQVYNYESRLELDYIPIPFYILVIVLVFLGSFYTLFILVSAAGNAISMAKKLQSHTNTSQNSRKALNSILFDQIFRGLLLVVFGYAAEVLFNGYVLNRLIPLPMEEDAKDMMSGLLHSQILPMIGWGVIFSALVFYLLMIQNVTPQKRNLVFIVLGIIIICIRPIAVEIAKLDPQFWDNPSRYWQDLTAIQTFLYFIGAQWVIRYNPLLPNLSLSFFGTVIGFQIAENKLDKKMLNRMLQASAIFVIAGFVIALTYDERGLNDFLIPSAGSLVALVIFLYFVEIRGKGDVFAKKTVFFRRFGVLTLTLWCLQWLMVFPLQIFHVILNLINQTNETFVNGPVYNGELDGWTTFGLFLVVTLMWHIILVLWEKIKFKGSLEWLTVKLMTHGKQIKGDRMDLTYPLYNCESIISEGQEFYSRKQKIGIFVLFFVYMIVNLVLIF